MLEIVAEVEALQLVLELVGVESWAELAHVDMVEGAYGEWVVAGREPLSDAAIGHADMARYVFVRMVAMLVGVDPRSEQQVLVLVSVLVWVPALVLAMATDCTLSEKGYGNWTGMVSVEWPVEQEWSVEERLLAHF